MGDQEKNTKTSLATEGIHSGNNTCPITGAIKAPVYFASSYEFVDVQDGAKKCKNHHEGYCYTRQSNPSQAIFEQKIANMEKAESALAFATGTAAISGLFMHFLSQGDHVIADKTSYSSTHYLLDHTLDKFGVKTSFIDTTDMSLLEKTIVDNTKLIYIESPANPTIKLVDIEKISEFGNKHGILTAIDSTFATPCLQNPIKLGIDVVIHSATKYIGGHADAMGGVLVGKSELMDKIRHDSLKNIGAVISPRNSYVFSRGLETLSLRMEKHCANAMEIAKFLQAHSQVKTVNYPGLSTHPQYEIAKKQMKAFGGMISFEVAGGLEAGKSVMENVKLCTLAVDLGHVKTLIEHPASMTHWYVDKKQRLDSGITDGLIRLSVGLESVCDIKADLQQAFTNI